MQNIVVEMKTQIKVLEESFEDFKESFKECEDDCCKCDETHDQEKN